MIVRRSTGPRGRRKVLGGEREVFWKRLYSVGLGLIYTHNDTEMLVKGKRNRYGIGIKLEQPIQRKNTPPDPHIPILQLVTAIKSLHTTPHRSLDQLSIIIPRIPLFLRSELLPPLRCITAFLKVWVRLSNIKRYHASNQPPYHKYSYDRSIPIRCNRNNDTHPNITQRQPLLTTRYRTLGRSFCVPVTRRDGGVEDVFFDGGAGVGVAAGSAMDTMQAKG